MLSKQLREELRNKGKGLSSNCLRHFNPHSRTLVDHHDAIGITQVHDLLSIGVVAGAERVCPQPAQQVEVLHNQGPVKAFAADLRGGEESNHSPSHRWAGASPRTSPVLPCSLSERFQPWAPFLADCSISPCSICLSEGHCHTHTQTLVVWRSRGDGGCSQAACLPFWERALPCPGRPLPPYP